MKKFFTVLLSLILVLAFASTGVFADSYPLLTCGDSPLIFSQVILQEPFLDVYFPSGFYDSVSVGDSFEIFNGLSLTVADKQTNNNISFNIVYNETSMGSRQFSVVAYPHLYFSTSSSSRITTSNTTGGSFSSISSSLTLTTLDISAGSSIAYTTSSSSNTYSLVLPYGNALAISSSSAFSITRRAYSVQNTTYNYQKYVRASDNFSYRVNGSYQGVVSNSALTGTFSVGVYGSNNVLDLLIPWQPVNQNILGRATDYNFYAGLVSELVSLTGSESFLIWYPYYANNQDTSKMNEVPLQISITVEHSAPLFFTTFPITGSTSSNGEDTYISNTASAVDSGSSTQTDDGNGNVAVSFDNAPTGGGNHGQAPINDNNSILGVLSNLQNTLLGLFNKAIDGIHNLISLGSSFLQSVQIMFSWLPSELLVIITSGFVILLTIGVLKTLWR